MSSTGAAASGEQSTAEETSHLESPKTPDNGSISKESNVPNRKRRRGAHSPSKRKLLDNVRVSKFRVPSDEEVKKREVVQNAIKEAVIDYQVLCVFTISVAKDRRKKIEAFNALAAELDKDSWMF